MRSNSYAWLSVANLIVHGLLTMAALMIVWLGWRRHRHTGYLVLTVWAVCALGNSVASMLLPLMQPWLQKLFPKLDPILLIWLPNMGGYLVSTLLLLAGLCLLVFRDGAPRPLPHPRP